MSLHSRVKRVEKELDAIIYKKDKKEHITFSMYETGELILAMLDEYKAKYIEEFHDFIQRTLNGKNTEYVWLMIYGGTPEEWGYREPYNSVEIYKPKDDNYQKFLEIIRSNKKNRHTWEGGSN